MAAVVTSGGNQLRASPDAKRKSRHKHKGSPREDQIQVLKSDAVSSVEPVVDAKGDLRCTHCCGRGCTYWEDEAEEYRNADWSDATEMQLKELLLGCLDAVYRSAVRRIAMCGYSEEAATRAVLMSGVSCKSRDAGRNALGEALSVLRDDSDTDPKGLPFESLEVMEGHVLEEMISVLREAHPFLSSGDAMWCLLSCDMDTQRALGIGMNPLGSGCGNEIIPSSSVPLAEQGYGSTNPPGANFSEVSECSNLERSAPSIEGVLLSMMGFPGFPCEKSNGSLTAISRCCISHSSAHMEGFLSVKKGQNSRCKRDSALRQKYFHIEKTCQSYGLKGSIRPGRLGNFGSLITDMKCRSFSESTGMSVKSAMAKIGKTIRSSFLQGDGVPMLSVDGGAYTCQSFCCRAGKCLSSSGVADNEIHMVPSIEKGNDRSCSSKPKHASPADTAKDPGDVNIPGSCMVGQQNLSDKKDELMLKLTWHIHELQIQLEEWKKWAQQKVVQAAKRLRNDKTEIQVLRQAKDEVTKLNKEKQMLEQNTLKKFTEMENALSKVGDQVAWASAAKCRLEFENAELRVEMEAAKIQASKSVASFNESVRRESDMIKNVQSWDRHKPILLEEIVAEKHKLSELQEKLNQASKYHSQLEARLNHEQKLKDELLMSGNFIAKEREKIEASAKAKEDLIRCKTDEHLRRHAHNIRKLEEQVVQLRWNSGPSNMVAPSWGADGAKVSSSGVANIHCISELVRLQESECGYHVPVERECVMCLSEEKCVLFLPCAHQVVCLNCNSLHEKQGMKDCPSCRTLIQQRIPVRFPSARKGNMQRL